jgi:arylsulfatase A-like enzyme
MTGKFGIHNGVVGHGGTAGDPRHDGIERMFKDVIGRECLPMVFRSSNYKTTLISPFAERHSSWTFNAGFNEIYNTGKSGMESAEEVTPVVVKWLEDNAANDNWFLYVNYWDAHTPYRAPLEYGNPFENEPLPAWITPEVLEQHREKVGPHSASEINMFDNKTNPKFPRHPGEIKNEGDLRRMIDGYDTGIRYVDDQIGIILGLLEQAGVIDDVAIIVTADHGENQGELGIYGEHATADQGTCRIPMIFRWPGGKQGHVDRGLHYHLDLAPTLAELYRKQSRPSWDGRSYAKTITEGADSGRDYLVISQCAHVCQRSVRFGDWLYVRTYHDGFHLFDKEMLFNLKQDPYEQRNVAQERKDICKEAVYLLNEWHDEMMFTMKHDVDPLWTVIQEGGPFHAKGHLKKYAEWLEQSGRGHAVPELMHRHPQEFE